MLPMPAASAPSAPVSVGSVSVLSHEAALDQLGYCCLVSPGVLALGMEEWIASFNPSGQSAVVTGLLIWDGRLMIHWLEAPRITLDALWERIQSDARQHCLVLLKHERGMAKRLFERWQMQPASRNEMMAIVREAREIASRAEDQAQASWQHAMSTLSILLNPELSPFYAQAQQPVQPAGSQLQGAPVPEARRA
jgi:hypothetical protein